jgi:ABC-type sugar transport system substrate-binding protein
MSRRLARLALALMLALAAAPGAAMAGGGHPSFGPGRPGIGDPYFPLDGNGGYDVATTR